MKGYTYMWFTLYLKGKRNENKKDDERFANKGDGTPDDESMSV